MVPKPPPHRPGITARRPTLETTFFAYASFGRAGDELDRPMGFPTALIMALDTINFGSF
jgi:hypothetical protein